MNYNNFMKLTLKNKKSAAAAMDVLRTRLDAGFDCDHTYRRNPSQLMRGDLELSGKTVVLCGDSGCYIPEDAIDVQIALMEDLANALSGEAFSCDFYNDCDCSASEVIAQYENGVLRIKSIYYPEGNSECLSDDEADDDLIEVSDPVVEEIVLSIK